MSTWDFYTNNSTIPVETGNSFEFEDIINTTNSWLDSLGNTFLKYREIKTAYNQAKQPKNKAREYENIQQKVLNSSGDTNFIYLAIIGVAFFILVKD